MVGGAREATPLTTERIASGTIGTRDVTAVRTTLRRIARINQLNGNTEQRAFIRHERTQLVEAPVAVSRSLGLANRSPLGDAIEVFKGDTKIVPLGLRDESFADAVVRVFLKAGLASRQLFEPALGALGADRLENLAALFVPPPLGLHLSAREGVTIGVYREVDHAEVHPQPSLGIVRRRRLDVADLMQVELAVPVDQISLSLKGIKHQALTLSALVRDMQAPLNRPDGHLLAVGVPTEDALVVGDRAVGFEGARTFMVELVGIADIGDSSHDNLGGQVRKRGAGFVVGQLVQSVLPEHFGFPRPLRQVVSRLIRLFHRAFESVGLFGRCSEFHLRDQFHIRSITHLLNLVKYRKENGAFLFPL